ncbi:MAG: zf-HC2 domain-containing protein [Nitrospinaceae bacterium]
MKIGWVDKIMIRLSLWINATCEDTSPYISESLDHPLPFAKRWRLRFHLAICQVCRYYVDQLKTIRALARRIRKEDNAGTPNAQLRPEFKEKLKKTLKSP